MERPTSNEISNSTLGIQSTYDLWEDLGKNDLVNTGQRGNDTDTKTQNKVAFLCTVL